ncbi:hypothetical protein DFH29DRAFT_1008546 [Suillus ampliporus]|nr:hypothetical protein DFH29DRAFT_1008546 [Suillus ampliporus]
MFRTKNRSAAITLLHRRINLSIDSALKFNSDDYKLCGMAPATILDFILVVSGSIGLHAFLPKTLSDHTFNLTLNLRLRSTQFRAKFGKPRLRSHRNAEDITIANENRLFSARKHGDTRLSSFHFRMAVMFIAFALAKIPSLPIHVMHPYGTDDDFVFWSIDDATNVLSQPTITLRLQDVNDLHDIIADEWDDWVAKRPFILD